MIVINAMAYYLWIITVTGILLLLLLLLFLGDQASPGWYPIDFVKFIIISPSPTQQKTGFCNRVCMSVCPCVRAVAFITFELLSLNFQQSFIMRI